MRAGRMSGVCPRMLSMAAGLVVAALAAAACTGEDPQADANVGLLVIFPDAGGGFDVAGSSDVVEDTLVLDDGGDVADTNESDAPADDALPPGQWGPACASHGDCKGLLSTPFCSFGWGHCVPCLLDGHCAATTGHCEAYQCTWPSCLAGATACKASFLATCNDSGKGWALALCPDDAPVCISGACKKCTPGQTFCASAKTPGAVPLTVLQCNADGAGATAVETCSGGKQCLGGVCGVCVAGTKVCEGGKAIVCDDDGAGWGVAQDCDAKQLACLGGLCIDPCLKDLKSKTHVGCRYWAVDLDNAIHSDGTQTLDAQHQDWAVIIANPRDLPAHVTITGAGHKGTWVVQPGEAKPIVLPDPAWQVAPLDLDGTMVAANAWRIDASSPIVVSQFNPLLNAGVYSNDASLLLPHNTLGTTYRAVGRMQSHDGHPAYIAVVATRSGPTTVSVTVTAATVAGVDSAGGAIAALQLGETVTVTLAQGEVFNLETGAVGADLTGSLIEADQPVAVFSGSEGANVPDTNVCLKADGAAKGVCVESGWPCSSGSDCPVTCCADHIEQQLTPIDSLAQAYVATRSAPRGKAPDYWRVVAVDDDTHVQTDPPQVPIPTLAAGAFFEFAASEDFVLQADKPLALAWFMASANAPDPNNDVCTSVQAGKQVCTAWLDKQGKAFTCGAHTDCPNIPQPDDAKIGDPAFVLVPPQARWLDDHVFLVPPGFTASWVNVAAPLSANVFLDGVAVAQSEFLAIGTTGFKSARLPVSAGVRRIAATAPVGLVVYGWGKYVSYGYPAGVGF